MKVHLIKKRSIELFVNLYPDSRNVFRAWLEKIRFADWLNTADIKRTFGSADFLGNGSNKVIFDIGGNSYRMICKYAFGDTEVHLFICWIGTHTAYDELCKGKLQYTTNSY